MDYNVASEYDYYEKHSHLPCPFCGSDNLGPMGLSGTKCLDCGARGPQLTYTWNHRVIPKAGEAAMTAKIEPWIKLAEDECYWYDDDIYTFTKDQCRSFVVKIIAAHAPKQEPPVSIEKTLELAEKDTEIAKLLELIEDYAR